MSDQLPPPPASGSGGWSPVGPYASSTAVVPPMRSLRGLAIALLVLFVIVALVDVVGAGALFNRAALIDDLLSSDPPSFSEGEDADSAVAGALGVHLFLAVALAVVFIIWQWRHAKNAETMGARGGLGPGWAIGGWFIPVANFVLPGVQIFQSSKASDLQARSHGARRGKGAGIVIAWAIAFGLANILLAGSGNLGETDDEGNLVFDSVDDVEAAADSDRVGGAGLMLMIPASALAAIMVWTLSKRQAEAYAAMTSATSAALSAPPATAYPPPPSGTGDLAPGWPQRSDPPAPPPAPPVVPSTPSTSGPEGWGTAPGAGSPASSAPPPPPAPADAGATPPPPIPPPPGAPAAPVASSAASAIPPPPAPPPKPEPGAPAVVPSPADAPGHDPAPPGTEAGADPASSDDEDSPEAAGPADAPAGPGASEDQPGWAASSPPPPPPAPPS